MANETAFMSEPGSSSRLSETIKRVCSRIAPSWPLDRFIAVNPYWGFTDLTPAAASAYLGALSGTRLLMPRAWFRDSWLAGSLRREHLRTAIERCGSKYTVEELEALLDSELPQVQRRRHVLDLADAQRDASREPSWTEFVRSDLSQFCAAYFDDGQARLGPDRRVTLYESYRSYAVGHRAPELLMGLGSYREQARALPTTARELVSVALSELGIPAPEAEAYLLSLLLDANGWAAWCAYLGWTARLKGQEDGHLESLLAMRLSWELVLFRAKSQDLASRWRNSVAAWPSRVEDNLVAQRPDWLLLEAAEIAYQRTLFERLGGTDDSVQTECTVQAAFCIDVRSEPLRRALEGITDEIQTLGFAGFFGLPADYLAIGADAARPQLPGLLSPRVRIADTTDDPSLSSRRAMRLRTERSTAEFRTSAVSSFSFVETAGLLYAFKLAGASLGVSRAVPGRGRAALTKAEQASCKPRLVADTEGAALSRNERAKLAAGILRAMSLTRRFARLVLLIGHGGESVNNPHASALDCGACGGQTGEVNARAVASLLNEQGVREELAELGIHIPDTTWFVAGMHNTTTDEVRLHDLDEVPASHAEHVSTAQHWLESAARHARAERAPGLGILARDARDIHTAVRGRAHDWSEVRPEWGLSNNACLIVAPRSRTRCVDLERRAFLHEYRWQEDEGFRVLEQIMTAPMVVANWINMQYFASVVDNLRYGSGNKVLHNVVGRHIGVFEGNGGDLRIGLPMQSVHDGSRWVHEPLRLTVIIDAPRDAMSDVIARNDKVRALVENHWIQLFQLDSARGGLFSLRNGEWCLDFEFPEPVQRQATQVGEAAASSSQAPGADGSVQ